MKTPAALTFTALAALTASGCAKSDATPTITGAKPVVVVQADCGQDGVANVAVTFGEVREQVLIGRNAVTQNLGGGRASFDSRYSLAGGYDSIPLTVTTDPTTGTCTTTLTDAATGDVVAQRETAGTATLTVNLKQG